MTDTNNKQPILILCFLFPLYVLTNQAFAGGLSTRVSGPTGALLGWIISQGRLSERADKADMKSVLRRAEIAYMDGGVRSTSALLACTILDPSFSEFSSTPEWDNAKYLMASSLAFLGATSKARKVLIELISKNPSSDFTGPALRKLVDLTLASKQFKQTLIAIDRSKIVISADQANEVRYLKGRALLKLGFPKKASDAFGSISNSSRMYASAVFMQGIISLEAGRIDAAEDFFCKLAYSGPEHKTPFYISDKASRVVENAWLALARIRHDQGHFEDSISTYSSISSDSSIFPIAQYESAWSQFRLGDFSGTEKTLQKLLESYSTFAQRPMAKILMGYSLLGQCNFKEATTYFGQVEKEQNAILASLKDTSLSAEVLPREVVPWIPSTALESNAIRLKAKIRDSFLWLRWLRWEVTRVSGARGKAKVDRPKLTLEQSLQYDIDRAAGILQLLAQMRVTLGTVKNKKNHSKLGELHSMQAKAKAAQDHALDALRRLRACQVPNPILNMPLSGPTQYLKEEIKAVASLETKLLHQNDLAKDLVFSARKSMSAKSSAFCAKLTRRAMLGNIDALTGKKQALESEIQNLAIGRYPLSLLKDLAKAGLLNEQSEYWPFDGESWPDEYE